MELSEGFSQIILIKETHITLYCTFSRLRGYVLFLVIQNYKLKKKKLDLKLEKVKQFVQFLPLHNKVRQNFVFL